MRRTFEPKDNVLYTFLYGDGKKRTFRYKGVLNSDYYLMEQHLPDGRIKLTKMTKSRFKFLMKNQLAEEKSIEEILKDYNKKQDDIERQRREQQDKQDKELDAKIKALINFIRSLTGESEEKATAFLGESPQDFADKIDKANGLEFSNNLLKAQSLIKHLKGA